MVKKTLQIGLASLVIFSFIFILFSNQVEAFSLMIPFGGKITSILPCTCPANLAWQITVGTPHPGVYMYKPGISTLYARYNILTPNNWVLGIATTYAPCLQASPTGCIPISTGGPLIRAVGTSAL